MCVSTPSQGSMMSPVNLLSSLNLSVLDPNTLHHTDSNACALRGLELCPSVYSKALLRTHVLKEVHMWSYVVDFLILSLVFFFFFFGYVGSFLLRAGFL